LRVENVAFLVRTACGPITDTSRVAVLFTEDLKKETTTMAIVAHQSNNTFKKIVEAQTNGFHRGNPMYKLTGAVSGKVNAMLEQVDEEAFTVKDEGIEVKDKEVKIKADEEEDEEEDLNVDHALLRREQGRADEAEALAAQNGAHMIELEQTAQEYKDAYEKLQAKCQVQEDKITRFGETIFRLRGERDQVKREVAQAREKLAKAERKDKVMDESDVEDSEEMSFEAVERPSMW
jgi:chromosome segregation ATPase